MKRTCSTRAAALLLTALLLSSSGCLHLARIPDSPETETAVPETKSPETSAPETNPPETDKAGTDAPVPEMPETEKAETEPLRRADRPERIPRGGPVAVRRDGAVYRGRPAGR